MRHTAAAVLAALFIGGCAADNDNLRQSFTMSHDGVRDTVRTDYSVIFNDLSDFLTENFETSNKMQVFSESRYRPHVESALQKKNIYLCEEDYRCKHQLEIAIVPDYKEHGISVVANYDGVSISRQYQKSRMTYKPVSPFSIMGTA